MTSKDAFSQGRREALARFGVKTANPGLSMGSALKALPLTPPRPGVMSTPSLRPQSATAVAPTPATAIIPSAPPTAAAAPGPSMADKGRAFGRQLGGAAGRFMRPLKSTLGLMGLGALGASMLHHAGPGNDDRLAYTPLPGSFIQ